MTILQVDLSVLYRFVSCGFLLATILPNQCPGKTDKDGKKMTIIFVCIYINDFSNM